MKKRVVVTGIGVIAPCGIGKQKYWEGLEEGKSWIKSDPEMIEWKTKSQVSVRVPDFSFEKICSSEGWDEVIACDRFVQMGVAAGFMALQDTLPLPNDEETKGIVFSSAIGGTHYIEDIFRRSSDFGKRPIQYMPIGPSFYHSGLFNYPASVLAQKYQFTGPVASLSTGCTAGLDTIGMSLMLIESGEARVMLAGASEAPLCPLTYATLDVIGSLSTAEVPPIAASCPFDKRRKGFVISEGAAFLVLEEMEYALKRGARIYAEIISYASQNNSLHMNELPHHGNPMAKVIAEALQRANLKPDQIDYINAHGSSTQQNDLFETNAYKSVFGEFAYKIPISSTKSIIGHSLSSASLLGSIAAIGSIVRSKIHPTANLDEPDPECDLFYTPKIALQKDVNRCMVTASGFGGIHSVAIFAKVGSYG